MLAETAAVFSTLKSATDILDRLRSATTKTDVDAHAATLAAMLADARIKVLDLVEEKATLLLERASLNERLQTIEAENRKLLEFSEDSEKYERIETPRGIVVYRQRQPTSANTQMPYLCPHCFAEKKERVLQPSPDRTFYQCHACKFGEYLVQPRDY